MIDADVLVSLMLQIYIISLNVKRENPHPLTGGSVLGIVYSSDRLSQDWQRPQVQQFWGQQLPFSASRVGIGTSIKSDYRPWASRQSMVKDSGCHGATG